MSNSIGPTGLTVATQAELVTNFTAAMEAIYGSDIDLDSDTPDGQMMMTFLQAVLDLEDLLVQINNMFDPDNAVGVILDQRVAINGIQRQAGTFTVTNITLVVATALNLYGSDQSAQPVYTVSDNAGNKFELQTSQTIATGGTYVYAFQAVDPGAVLTIPNTITVPVTIVLGVTSVNNPTAATVTGVNEESDATLKVRRQQSVALSSQGYYAGLYAALKNITGVTYVQIYENKTGSTNADGVPSHSIWVVVGGTGAAADIANAIYLKRNAGCGMFGSQSYTITQIDDSLFVVQWDNVATQNLFIAFTASSIDGVNQPNIAAIRSGLVTSFIPSPNGSVNVNQLATAVQAIDSNTLVTGAGFSTGQTQVATLSGVAASGVFKVAYNGVSSANINWNDSISTIQTKVQAVTGLSGCLVTGSIASQTLTFNLAAISPILGLITINSNTLQTGGAVAITMAFNEGYANTLSPSAKNYQFQIQAANIVITPMVLTPSAATVSASATKQFTGLGGYGTPVYSLSVNNSGGSIDTSTGLYTAGPTNGVNDTVKVVDLFGNSITAIVAVV